MHLGAQPFQCQLVSNLTPSQSRVHSHSRVEAYARCEHPWVGFVGGTLEPCLPYQVWNPTACPCQFSSVQFSCSVFVTPWTAAHQPFLSITNSWSLLKFTSIELVMPSNHLILCRPPLLLPSIFPSIRVFSNESVLCISPFNEYSGLISFRIV